MNIAALIAALIVALGLAPAPPTIDVPGVGLEHAVRLSQEPPVILESGTTTDTTGLTPSPLGYLQALYTPAELAAGGPVVIVPAELGIYAAVVSWIAGQSGNSQCDVSPICIQVAPGFWTTSSIVRNRSVMAHEWGHVLTERYRKQMTSGQARRFETAYRTANLECIADSLAAIILERDGFPPSTGRYQCGPFWANQGLDPVEMEQLSLTLARTVLDWAE